MRVLYLFIGLTFYSVCSIAQPIKARLVKAMQQLETDPQMRHATIGFCVADTKTGKILFEKNSQTGLVPASTQKIITSIAAFDLLGKDFRYATRFRIRRPINDKNNFDMEILPEGDPTFGSWRYKNTRDTVIFSHLMKAIKNKIPGKFNGKIYVYDNKMGNAMPGGFTWEDMGNYYGAGSRQLNWHENQYDLYFNSKGNGPTELAKTVPSQSQLEFVNLVMASSDISGDEIYVYTAPESKKVYVEGQMPVNKKAFTVSGSMPDPAFTFVDELLKYSGSTFTRNQFSIVRRDTTNDFFTLPYFEYDSIYTHYSPTLDSINFYFLRRSVNLFGEALLKTLVFSKTGLSSTEKGVDFIREYFASKGIDKAAIHISDGSGLSPQNRVTPDAFVRLLQYAKSKPWFSSFYYGLPEFNGMKMKSGSIGGARAYAGYHKATDGNEYTFSIIINNFDGSAGEVVKKMYKLLDVLK